MQFREQGKKVQCIRSSYDPVSKRSHQKVAATFDRLADQMPAVEVVNLTDGERQALAVWFNARQWVKAERLKQQRASIAGETLAELAESIRGGGCLSVEQAGTVWRGMDAIAKALRRAGHPKPKRARGAAVVNKG